MGTSREESPAGSLGDSSEESGLMETWMENPVWSAAQGVGRMRLETVHQGTVCPCMDGDL